MYVSMYSNIILYAILYNPVTFLYNMDTRQHEEGKGRIPD